jgi:hypothetical protein
MCARITVCIVVASVICLSALKADAQTARESVRLGSINLVLGMPQDVVMAALTREI